MAFLDAYVQQIKENMCGTCTSLGGGAFRLEAAEGLRFGGKSYDDNMIGKGSMQVHLDVREESIGMGIARAWHHAHDRISVIHAL